jgi:tetratricopeptide (TPR) repeat protein
MPRNSKPGQNLRRCLREAEGYLELATLFDEGDGLEQTQKLALADLCVQTLDRIKRPGRHVAQIVYLRGQAHRLAGRFHRAISDLQSAAKLVPGNIHTSLALGWCFKRIGKIELAVDVLQSAIVDDSSSGILQYNLACYLTLAGRHQMALVHLARSIEIDGRFRFLAAHEPDFHAIRNEPDFRELATFVA